MDDDLDLGGEDDLSLDDGTGDELSLDDDDPLPAMDDDLDLGGEEELPPLDASSQDPDETVLELDTPAEEALEAPTEDAAIELELDETSGESMVEIDEPEADDLSIEADTDEITLGMEADDLNLEKDEFQAAPDVDIGEVDLDLEEIESAPPEVDSFEEGPDAAMEDEEIVDLDLGDSEDAGEAVAGGVFEAVPDVDIDEVKFEDLVGAEFEEMEEEGMGEDFIPPLPSDLQDGFDSDPFVAVPDVNLQDEKVLELNMSDLEHPLPSAEIEEPPASRFGYSSTDGTDDALEFPLGVEKPEVPVSQGAGLPGHLTGIVDSDILLSIPRKINVEMGSISLNGHEIMELGYGSVVQLPQTVGDPVELVLEGHSIAKGEIVLINGRNLGVRILSLNKK